MTASEPFALRENDMDWLSVEDAQEQLPAKPGVYFLGYVPGLMHGPKAARTVYVGSSSNVRRRIKNHAGAPSSVLVRRILERTPDNLRSPRFRLHARSSATSRASLSARSLMK